MILARPRSRRSPPSTIGPHFFRKFPMRLWRGIVGQANFPILMIDQSFSDASRDFILARDAKLLDAVRTMARARWGWTPCLKFRAAKLRSAKPDEPTSVHSPGILAPALWCRRAALRNHDRRARSRSIAQGSVKRAFWLRSTARSRRNNLAFSRSLIDFTGFTPTTELAYGRSTP